VLLDELAARLDLITHEGRENIVSATASSILTCMSRAFRG